MDYYGLVEEIPLKDEERKRFKNFDGFIDKSTCGLLVEKLKGTSALKTPKASKILGRACEHRNRLAHRYLMEHEFSPEMTDNAMRSILHELHLMTMDLYVALVISQAYLDHAQHESDRRERVWCKFNEELGLPTYEDMKRKYVLPSKWKTSKQSKMNPLLLNINMRSTEGQLRNSEL
jgi:hypothetical protein